MRIKGGLLIILTVCLGTALAMAASEQDDTSGNVVGAITKDARNHADAGNAEKDTDVHFDMSSIKRPIPKMGHSAGLFESKSWYVQPVNTSPIPAYVPPPQPITPSLPFTFIGRMLDGKDAVLFLSRNDRQYVVKERDVLEDTYRVDKISDNDVVLTYLPTNTSQTLIFNTAANANVAISTSELK